MNTVDRSDAMMPDEWKRKLRKRIGANIRRKRTEEKMTIYALAKRCGVSWHTIQLWEKGTNTPQLDLLWWMCKCMSWNLRDIFGGAKDG